MSNHLKDVYKEELGGGVNFRHRFYCQRKHNADMSSGPFISQVLFVNLCVRGGRGAGTSAHAAGRAQLEEMGFLLLPCGSEGSNSGGQTWGQVALITQSLHQLFTHFNIQHLTGEALTQQE